MEAIKHDHDLSKQALASKEIDESKLKMCQDMIRKDFEIVRLQNVFLTLFNETQFFSRHEDEFLSIEHTIQIAFERKIENFQEGFVNCIYECGLNLAYQTWDSSKDESLKLVDQHSKALCELIFKASRFKSEYESLCFFLQEFMKAFPKVEMPWAKSFLKSSSKNSWVLQ